ncbi:hypothetical protein, partial [Coprococcus eutactus]|uniref:hypothetical protein n=1 Tax=Coprococcus eutactus TaxID=33043 RepID=UPI00210977C7
VDETDEIEYKYMKRNARPKLRLLRTLKGENIIPMSKVTGELGVSSATEKAMQEEGVITVTEDSSYRKVTSD